LELSTDSDDGDFSEEEELESGDTDSFMVKPHGTIGVGDPRGVRVVRQRSGGEKAHHGG
jgi:hypothetical protein